MELIAAYSDGSGDYRIQREGDSLVTTISHGGRVSERITETLERAPELEGEGWEEWMLTDRFGSCPDMGANGAVLIDGLAYAVTD